MSLIYMLKSIYFLSNVERETMNFKTYDTRLHIQMIYCRLIGCFPVAQLSGRLIGCCPVATELNYQQYNIKSQYLVALKKCVTVVWTVPLQGMPLIYMFKRLGHTVKRELYTGMENSYYYDFKHWLSIPAVIYDGLSTRNIIFLHLLGLLFYQGPQHNVKVIDVLTAVV